MRDKVFSKFLLIIYPLTDFVTIAFAIMFSYKFYRILHIGKYVYYPKIQIVPVSLLASLITIIVMLNFEAYKRESSILNVEEIKNVVKGISFTFLLFMVILVFGKFQLSRYVLIFSYFSSIILVVIERTAIYYLHPFIKVIKEFNKRILIYGAGELGQALFRSIANSPKLGIVPVGFIDDNPDKADMVNKSSSFSSTSYGLAVLGTRKDIGRLINQLEIDEIYVAISNIDTESLIGILNILKMENVKISFVPNLYQVFLHKVKIEQIGQIPIIHKQMEKVRISYLHIKRYIDLFMVIISLFLFWPVFLIISLAIKIDSKGPVFFMQNRVGRNGNVFKIYKFRSMSMETDPYTVNPLDQNDPRITRVGKFLRKTSLDELPQIINVLKGDMSFVGPRPEMPFIVEKYNEIHKERLKVLPGITGLWQLSGDRERAIHENMDYDLYYIRNMSLFLDVAILIETLIFAFRGV